LPGSVVPRASPRTSDGRGGFSLLPEPLGLRLHSWPRLAWRRRPRPGIVRGECLLARAEIAEDPARAGTSHRRRSSGRTPPAVGRRREPRGEHVFIVNAGGAPLVEADSIFRRSSPPAPERGPSSCAPAPPSSRSVPWSWRYSWGLTFPTAGRRRRTRLVHSSGCVLFGARALGAVALTCHVVAHRGLRAATPMAPASLLLDAGLTICLVAILADAVYWPASPCAAFAPRRPARAVIRCWCRDADRGGAIAGLFWRGSARCSEASSVAATSMSSLSLHPEAIGSPARRLDPGSAPVSGLVTIYSPPPSLAPTRSRMTTAVQILLRGWRRHPGDRGRRAGSDRGGDPALTMLIMSAAALDDPGPRRFRHGSHAHGSRCCVLPGRPALPLYPSWPTTRSGSRSACGVGVPASAIGHLQDSKRGSPRAAPQWTGHGTPEPWRD